MYKPYDSQVLWIDHLNSLCAFLVLKFHRSTLVWPPWEPSRKPARASHRFKKSMASVLFSSHWQELWGFEFYITSQRQTVTFFSIYMISLQPEEYPRLSTALFTPHVHQQGKSNILDFPGKSLKDYIKRYWVKVDELSWFLLLKWCLHARRKIIFNVLEDIPPVWK